MYYTGISTYYTSCAIQLLTVLTADEVKNTSNLSLWRLISLYDNQATALQTLSNCGTLVTKSEFMRKLCKLKVYFWAQKWNKTL